MTGRELRRGALVLRLLGVLGVVAGVFAMHGLTAHHDAAMAIGHPTETVSMHAAVSEVEIAPAADHHGMGEACVAVLNGLVLVLTLLLGLRSLLAWRPAFPPAATRALVVSDRAPPWLAPSLSGLCVLRI